MLMAGWVVNKIYYVLLISTHVFSLWPLSKKQNKYSYLAAANLDAQIFLYRVELYLDKLAWCSRSWMIVHIYWAMRWFLPLSLIFYTVGWLCIPSYYVRRTQTLFLHLQVLLVGMTSIANLVWCLRCISTRNNTTTCSVLSVYNHD
jgi:hypothetical protein